MFKIGFSYKKYFKSTESILIFYTLATIE